MTFEKTFRRGDRVVLDGHFGAFQRAAYRNQAVVIWEKDGQPAPVDYDSLAHAPVLVIGPRPPAAPRRCPQCGNALTLDPDAIKFTPRPDGQRPVKTKVRVAACGFCDFIQEIPK